MEAITRLKFWKSNSAKVAVTTASDGDASWTATTITNRPVEEMDDDEDSFFELELTLRNCECKRRSDDVSAKKPAQNDNHCVSNGYNHEFNSAKRCTSASHSDDNNYSFITKINAADTKSSSKPQPPISILRSSARLRILTFGRLGKLEADKVETECGSDCSRTQPQRRSKPFAVRFRIEDASIIWKFSRSSSSRNQRRSSDNSTTGGSSKPFSSNEGVRKYLNLLKPLYVKVSDRNRDKSNILKKFSQITTSLRSPSKESLRSTATFARDRSKSQNNRPRVSCNHLRKSRSASSVVGVASPIPIFPVNRKDDSLQQRHDGIEGAILHCKRSLNSTRGA
ncbi:hypothetical protein Nepgr_021473 [Nepenthes gracilis]|uniref:Uncharacterized protein n=1 Tax=Nepenthes gracilis TaxID=150966 RepID=A0AAD3XVZ1_NEPGR|nr:hypothetical protein Nepgr_021473 [Nepenthes gracilis]